MYSSLLYDEINAYVMMSDVKAGDANTSIVSNGRIRLFKINIENNIIEWQKIHVTSMSSSKMHLLFGGQNGVSSNTEIIYAIRFDNN
jgi:hypothetical protein